MKLQRTILLIDSDDVWLSEMSVRLFAWGYTRVKLQHEPQSLDGIDLAIVRDIPSVTSRIPDFDQIESLFACPVLRVTVENYEWVRERIRILLHRKRGPKPRKVA